LIHHAARFLVEQSNGHRDRREQQQDDRDEGQAWTAAVRRERVGARRPEQRSDRRRDERAGEQFRAASEQQP